MFKFSLLFTVPALILAGMVAAPASVGAQTEASDVHVNQEPVAVDVVDDRFPDVKIIDFSSQEAIDSLTPEELVMFEENFGNDNSGATTNTQHDTVNSCFDYYNFNSIQVVGGPEVEQVVPGTILPITGVVYNENPYPVTDLQLYAKVFRINDSALESGLNGYPLVKFMKVVDDLTLPANGELPFQFDLEIPYSSVSGEYQIAFFATVASRFNMLGLTFTDDVVGNTTHFSVVTESTAVPGFDKNSVTLNGDIYEFANFPPEFRRDEDVVFEADIVNPLDKEAVVDISYSVFDWDGLREENIIDLHEETYILEAGETRRVQYIAPSGGNNTVSYIIADAVYKDSHSILNPRFVRDGIRDGRLALPGIMQYPIQAGTENTLFSCVHAMQMEPIDGELTLALKTVDGETIHQYTYEGMITGQMTGIADTFTAPQTYTDFDVVATLKIDGIKKDTVTIPYRCVDIDENICPDEVVAQETKSSSPVIIIVISIIFLLIIMQILYSLVRKKNIPPPTTIVLALVIVTGLILPNAASAEVDYVHALGHAFTTNSSSQTASNKSVLTSGSAYVSPPNFFWAATPEQVRTNAIYRARSSVPEGVVPQGTSITVSHPRSNTDTSWMASGFSYSTPYGCWSDMKTGNWNCTNTPRFSGLYGYNMGVVVNSPNYTVQGNGAISCSGNSCTAAGVGSGSIRITYLSTSARVFYSGYSGNLSSGSMTLPSRTITFNYTVTETNTPPNQPVLSCPVTATVGNITSITVRATDPDGDNIRYGIDWDNNSTIDGYIPGSGYVNSGTSQTPTVIPPSAGTYTVRARTYDDKGGMSSFGSCVVTVTEPSYSCTGFRPSHTTIHPGDTTGLTSNLSWQHSNIDNPRQCEYRCNTGYTWNGSSCEVVPPPPPTGDLTSLGCIIPNGDSNCQATLSWDIENVTAGYITEDSTTIQSGITTDGSRSVTLDTNATTYRLYEDTGTVPLLDTLSLTAACASGSAWSTDTNTCETVPGAPTLSIEADPSIIRSGQKATIKISIAGSTNLSCTLLNAETTPVNVNYTTAPATQDFNLETRELTATQVITLSCPVPGFSNLPPYTAETRVEIVPTVQEI